MKNSITTHVLDTMQGKPAPGISVTLEMKGKSADWTKISSGTTNPDGRIDDFFPDAMPFEKGIYRLTFETAAYFRSIQAESFYPHVQIVFEVKESSARYHVPLLLSPFGYSTYRGS